MHYQEIEPRKELSNYLKCIWMLEDEQPADTASPQKVLPDGCAELIIHYGSHFKIETAGKLVKQPRSFIFGALTRPIELYTTGPSGMIAARFYPGGLFPFVQRPLRQLTDRYISLSSLYGKKGKQIEATVLNAPGLQQRAALLQDFLSALLTVNPPAGSMIPHRIAEMMINKDKAVKIEALSRQLNVGRRHLERKFIEQTGMTPKMLFNIIRFQNIFRIMNNKKIRSLTDLSYEAGYYDQSHFNRDFKRFAGASPKEHFKENAAFTKLFVES